MVKDIRTETFTVAEISIDELKAPSGVVDEQGREVSTEQMVRDILDVQGYRTWTSMNGALSPEAKQVNSAVTNNSDMSPRQKAGAYLVAVRAERPVEE
ncbi:hypothetical protein KC968_00010 [Candidatus Saccharibacteria bacterium]|nr:hypothetical protein [Candidatus Saccharibacteria bacterium]